MINFEKQWLDKFENQLTNYVEIKIREQILHNHTHLEDPITWTQYALTTLKTKIHPNHLKAIMTGCACHYPHEKLETLQNAYHKTQDLDYVHQLLQEQFIREIKDYKQLNDAQLQFIIDEGWGLAGRKEGNIIYATKIPSKFHEYFQATDKQERAYCYCHCPRIREAILTNDEIPIEYCYCGAGFYQDVWQTILMRNVDVEIVKSVLKGDQVCQIKITL